MYAEAALAEASHRYDSAEVTYARVAQLFSKAPIADDALIRSAEMLVKLGRPNEAVAALDSMQDTMLNSPLLDQAAFRSAEITERDLHDRAHAQKRYEDFLAHYAGSTYTAEARERARKLRGDAF
jgi:outer membrane protein assembly factor BamD (BamD/ComL family)